MDVGMMCFAPDPQSGYGDKIEKAAAYYRGGLAARPRSATFIVCDGWRSGGAHAGQRGRSSHKPIGSSEPLLAGCRRAEAGPSLARSHHIWVGVACGG